MRTYEDAILSEAELLVENINKLNDAVKRVNETELIQMIERSRKVEKKMSLVFTFFKASMYSNYKDNEEGTNRPTFQ